MYMKQNITVADGCISWPQGINAFPIGRRNIHGISADGKQTLPIEDFYVYVRPDPTDTSKPKPLTVMPATYVPIANKRIYRHVQETLDATLSLSDFDGGYIIDKQSHGGNICWREYVLPAVARVSAKTSHENTFGFRVVVMNSYNGTLPVKLYAGAIDFACENGMILGEYASFIRRHTRHASADIDTLHIVINDAISRFAKLPTQVEVWRSRAISDVDEHLRLLTLPDQLRNKLIAQYNAEVPVRGANAWALYSALTYYASHVDERFPTRASNDTMQLAMHKRTEQVCTWLAKLPIMQIAEAA